MVEQLGALLTPVAASVAVGAIRAVPIKGRKYVESKGRGHNVVLKSVMTLAALKQAILVRYSSLVNFGMAFTFCVVMVVL